MRKNVLLALNWYNVDIHRGVAEYACKHDWNLCSEPAQYVGWLPTDWEGDGIITNVTAENSSFIKGNGLHAVHIGQPDSAIDFDCVRIDSESICRLSTDYFVERGYKRFAWFTNKAVKDPVRLRYFRSCLNEYGYDCVFLNFPTMVKWNENRIKLVKTLKKIKFPIAVFCSDDNAAAEVITACLDYGLQVPEQVAVLGVHNNDLVCESLSVSLSSVAVDFFKVGYLSAYLLDRRMRGLAAAKRVLNVKADEVISRKSTELLAVDHPEVARALRYIQANFNRGIKVKDVVRKTRITEKGLANAFQREIGKTIGQYIRLLKLEYAEKQLADKRNSIGDIAIECGFSDYHGFYEAFKKKNGMTPLQFRKKLG